MAEIQVDGGYDAPEDGIAFGTMANWAGAAVSLALLFGIGVWGYQLVTRDVSGIPVVRAASGPMRIQPEDPGGAAEINKGLAVNMVAAKGSAEDPAEQLILAPKPIDLSEEDLSQGALATAPVPSAAEAPAPSEPTTVDDLVASLTQDAEPLEALAPAEAKTPDVAKEGLGTSLRPKVRPEGLMRSTAPQAPAAPVGPVDVDAGSLPTGTRLAQLGAYESAEIARSEWDRLYGRFGDYMSDKKRVIQKAESGGRTFYRLRAHGFADINEARRFCSALVAEKAECIPVTTR